MYWGASTTLWRSFIPKDRSPGKAKIILSTASARIFSINVLFASSEKSAKARMVSICAEKVL
jgi:hypothetical protein